MAVTYPSTDFQSGSKVLASLGSFWTDVFSDQYGLKELYNAQLEEVWQTYINYLELIACLSRYDVPLYHTQLWQYVTIKKSELNNSKVAPLTYGTDKALYGAEGTAPYNKIFDYGEAVDVTAYRYPITADIVGSRQILSSPIEPKVILSEGVDFIVDGANSYIEFKVDPFKNSNFVTRSIVNSDGNSDEELELWLYKSTVDYNYVYKQFGYVVSLYFKDSTDSYKQLLNALWDALIEGPSVLSLRMALSAITGLPVVKEDTETVEVIISTDPRSLQIITDCNVYTYPKTCTASVSVGDIVHKGDFLVTSVQLAEPPDVDGILSDVTGIVVSNSLLDIDLDRTLTFANGDNGTTITTVNGSTQLVFSGVDGTVPDVVAFWDYVNTTRRSTGYTLAKALRAYKDRTDEPTADELPATVNPAKLLFQLVWPSNIVIIKMYLSKLGNGLGLDALKHLRKFLPPHVTAYIIQNA